MGYSKNSKKNFFSKKYFCLLRGGRKIEKCLADTRPVRLIILNYYIILTLYIVYQIQQ